MCYLRGSKKLPVLPPTEPTREDEIFAALRRDVPKPRAPEDRRNKWILSAAWRLVDERVSACQDPAKGQSLIRRLGRATKAIMTTDRRRRAEEAGEKVEALVGADPPLIQETWHCIKGWYKAAFDPLRRDPLEGNSSGRQSTVERSLIPPLYPVPCLLD